MATMTKLARFSLLITFGFGALVNLRADQVVMQNGDQYHGKILSVSPTNVVLQSAVLGVVNLSRTMVANLTLGLPAVTNAPARAATVKTNAASDLSAVMRQMGNHSNLVNQVRAQFLATAGPEVNQKFDQMMGDLTSGKMSIVDLRAQAKSTAAQLRELEQAGGEGATGTMGLYLSILDNFLAETEPATPAVTNRAAQRKP